MGQDHSGRMLTTSSAGVPRKKAGNKSNKEAGRRACRSGISQLPGRNPYPSGITHVTGTRAAGDMEVYVRISTVAAQLLLLLHLRQSPSR
ncbi:hypothetical protein NHX12_029863 [Muraenolepis orangiensis]|uniref:Uncharacterized protein n=1 Tax=Muraenolepis orangiensis TaxID=630683 RepID=A0A9Q0E718_9TELE|nr:hypothetical protein NHX12_029863 [Muraenolepis orangiensis]